MYHYAPKQQMQHQQLGQFNWIEALSNPDETINKYKDVAIKEGTRLALLFVVSLVLLNAVTTSLIVSSQLKKRR